MELGQAKQVAFSNEVQKGWKIMFKIKKHNIIKLFFHTFEVYNLQMISHFVYLYSEIKIITYQFILSINMFYTKSSPKTRNKEEDIQPWNAEESNMLHLIIESADIQPKPSKNISSHQLQEQKTSPTTASKEPHSYNFCNNLRKYEKKKAQEFNTKKEVNFIEKNIKGVSQDLLLFNENSPIMLANKSLQDKNKKGKAFEPQYNSTIEPINWSLIMYYEEIKGERKHRHKDIQSFLRFQSQKMEKNSLRKESLEQKIDNIEQNKYEGNKYQKLLKLREGLRKRNLKSASESRKIIDNSLSIEENSKIPKPNNNSIGKAITRRLPKTSQSVRNTDTIIKIENSPQNSPKKYECTDPRIIYTSYRNRINSFHKKSIDENRLSFK